MLPQRSIRLFKYGPERAAWGGDQGAEEEEERPVRCSPDPTRPLSLCGGHLAPI